MSATGLPEVLAPAALHLLDGNVRVEALACRWLSTRATGLASPARMQQRSSVNEVWQDERGKHAEHEKRNRKQRLRHTHATPGGRARRATRCAAGQPRPG